MKSIRIPTEKLRFKSIAFILSIIVAVFFVLQILGKPVVNPFPTRLEFEAPSVCRFGDRSSLIVDRQGTRLLFLDENRKLDHLISFDDASLIDDVLFVTADDGHYYLTGSKYAKDSDDIDYDRIVRYDFDGSHPVVVFELDRTGDAGSNIAISEGCVEDNHLIVGLMNPEEGQDAIVAIEVDLMHPEAEPKELFGLTFPMAYSARYERTAKVWYVSNQLGQLYTVSQNALTPRLALPGHIVDGFLPIDRDQLVWFDTQTNQLKLNDRVLVENCSAYYYLSYSDNCVYYDHSDDDGLSRVNLTDGSVTDFFGVDYSLRFTVLTWIRWLSVAYLAALILWLVIKNLVHTIRAGNTARLKKIGVVLGLVVISAGVAAYYTYNIVAIQKEELYSDIVYQANYISKTVDIQTLTDAQYKPELMSDSQAMAVFAKAQQRLDDQFSIMKAGAAENTKNANIMLLKKDGDKLITVYDSWRLWPVGSLVNPDDFLPRAQDADPRVSLKLEMSLYYQTAPILNNRGELEGVAVYGQNYDLSNGRIFNICFDMSVTLLTIAIILYLFLTECGEFITAIRKRKRVRLSGGSAHDEVILLRTITFLLYFVSIIDAMVIVPISQSLLENQGIAATPFLLALPGLLVGVGDFLGSTLYRFLSVRITAKKTATLGCGILFFGQLLNVFAIVSNSFPLFCALKFVTELGAYMLIGTGASMRVKPLQESDRYTAGKSFYMGRLSGMVFGALVSGIVVQRIGTTVIYLISAAADVPLFILMMKVLPSKTVYIQRNPIRNQGKEGQYKQIFGFLLKLPMLAYLLLMVLPIMIIQGYTGYLFPIYSTATAMPTMYITFFYALSRTVLMLLSDPVEKQLKNVDHWKSNILFVCMIGMGFLGFFVNSGIIWAIIMLVITGSVENFALPSLGILWARQAKSEKIPLERLSGIMTVLEEMTFSLKELILSFFLFFGNQWACIIAGGFCLISILLFAIFTRKSPMAVSEQQCV